MLYIVTALKPEAQAFVDYHKNLKKEKLDGFTIFKNHNLILIISHIGVENARIATQTLIDHFDITDDDIYCNVGICGAPKEYPIGTLLEIGTISYKNSRYRLNNASKTITCHDRPISEKSHTIVDMESYGFYDAVVHNPAIKKAYIFKIVSDHFQPHRVNKENTKKVIFNLLYDIHSILEKGEGIIISSRREKYPFTAMEWNDFDVMPQQGLVVSYEVDGDRVQSITTTLQEESAKEQKEEKEQNSVIPNKKSHSPQAFRYKNRDLTQTEAETFEKLADYKESIDAIGKNIKLTASISQTIKEYFHSIEINIKKRVGYKKVQGRLNYLLAKRFIWTTYNNLQEIDFGVITPRIKSITEDLQVMDELYKDFEHNIKYPTVAFENIFLANQKEYNYLHKLNKEIYQRLSILKMKEERVNSLKEAQKAKFENISKKDRDTYVTQMDKLKVLNGTYVDIVHMIAKLQEQYKQNHEKINDFSTTYRGEFLNEFQKEAKIYKSAIIEILDAQAYLLDANLWKEAKTSKAILAYFNELSIDVELNAKGYLKYYLNSLDETKSSENTKELFELYEHLQEVQKDYIIILLESVQDAMELEQTLQNICPEMKIKAFIDEISAFKWAMLNHVKIIVMEEYINAIDAKKFLDFYHNAIFSKPKILLIGNQLSLSSKNYVISKRLPAQSSIHTIIQTVKELYQHEI